VEGKSAAHLLRLWAFEEIHRLIASGEPTHAAQAVNSRNSIDSSRPVSGAVVLETQRDYDRAGLDPNTQSAADAVPEPATWFLIVFGAVLLFAAVRKRRLAR
jgi:hypothetical protein